MGRLDMGNFRSRFCPLPTQSPPSQPFLALVYRSGWSGTLTLAVGSSLAVSPRIPPRPFPQHTPLPFLRRINRAAPFYSGLTLFSRGSTAPHRYHQARHWQWSGNQIWHTRRYTPLANRPTPHRTPVWQSREHTLPPPHSFPSRPQLKHPVHRSLRLDDRRLSQRKGHEPGNARKQIKANGCKSNVVPGSGCWTVPRAGENRWVPSNAGRGLQGSANPRRHGAAR